MVIPLHVENQFLRVMWNSPFKDKLVPKELFDLAQPDPKHMAVKRECCEHNLPTLIG